MKKRKFFFNIILFLFFVLCVSAYVYSRYKDYLAFEDNNKNIENIINDIKSHYNTNVIISKDTYLYSKNKDIYDTVGRISKDEILKLDSLDIDKNTEYFYSSEIGYYVYYKDVTPTEENKIINKRYKNYIMFNENIVTHEEVNLYRDDKVIYTLYKSLDLPIFMKDKTGYYVEYFNELFFVKSEDVVKKYFSDNTDIVDCNTVPVVVYHTLDNKCNDDTCHKDSQIKEQFSYLRNNNYFTLNSKELKYFIEGYLKLPEKSILITIDSDINGSKYIPFLEKYKVNATLFIPSSLYDSDKLQSDYLELGSYSHDLYKGGYCEGGEGSAFRCLDKDDLLEDLNKSKDILKTNIFSYPFYEYNSHAIEVIKKADFDMAFIGGFTRVRKNINLLMIPRIPLYRYTTLDMFKSYVK